jgi:hypothetical protein
MSTYDTINIIIMYEFTDLYDNLTLKMHAVNIYFDFDSGMFQLYDSNQKNVVNMNSDEKVFNLFSEMYRAYIMVWNLKFSSRDPNAISKGFSYNMLMKILDNDRVKDEQEEKGAPKNLTNNQKSLNLELK